MKIFVTGGAGYVGSHCVKRLVEAGHEITVFDNLSKGHRGAVDPKAKFVEGDLADQAKIREVFAATQFDAVMHFAASLNVGESVFEPLLYFRNNIANTVNMLDEMKTAGIKKIVFSSTCAVYGVPDELPLVEDLPKAPISPYGESKLAMEWMLKDCTHAWGLGATALRYFNASGAAVDGTIGQDYTPTIHIIPVLFEVAQGKRENAKLFGTDYPTPDGSCVRDYIHMDDLAEAHLRAIEAVNEGQYNAYNVGTGKGNSVIEIIQAVRDVTGHPIPVIESPRREGDPPELYANADKIFRELGWKAKHLDVREIIETAWNWRKAHPNGYED